MNLRTYRSVAVSIITCICVWIISGLIAGCCSQSEAGQSRSQFAFVGGISIYTATHDGHRWVVSNQGGIVHHPDCQCNKGGGR